MSSPAAGHTFTPWKFATEANPYRWSRLCKTCPVERAHWEISPSPLPPEGALAEMEPWERDLLASMTEGDWIAASPHRKTRGSSGPGDWINR